MSDDGNCRVFVGNIQYDVDDGKFHDHLTTNLGLAVADSKIITERETGRSRGFGFVTFHSPQAAHEAIEVIGGSLLGGRPLAASPANAREDRGGSRRGRR